MGDYLVGEDQHMVAKPGSWSYGGFLKYRLPLYDTHAYYGSLKLLIMKIDDLILIELISNTPKILIRKKLKGS